MSHARVLANPKRQTLMWLPAAALITAGLLAAIGFGGVARSDAASTGTSTVSATVGSELHIGGTCPGYNGPGPALATTDATTSLGSCTLTFGTNNNATGSLIRVESQRPTAGNDAFCSTAVTLACGATKFTNASTAGAASLADGQFGVLVNGVPTCNTATWTNGNYYGIANSNTAGNGNLICDNANQVGAVNDASYNLQFSANPGPATVAATYQASAVFTVETS